MADATRIVLTAEDRTQAAFSSASASLQAFAASASRLPMLGGLAGLGAGGLVAALGAMARGAIDAADEMNDLSQRVGIGIKDLAGFKLAAEQSGTSMESVARGVKGLSVFMVENGKALADAGITAKTSSSAIIQLADLFKVLPDGIEKTALAVKLFGKAGLEMVPMLNLGSAGLADAQRKTQAYADKLAELAPKADEFNDRLRELKLQGELAGLSLGNLAVGPLTNMVTAFNDLASGGEKALGAMKKLADAGHPAARSFIAWKEALDPYLNPEGGARGYTGPKDKLGLPDNTPQQMLPGGNSAAETEALARARKLLGNDGKAAAGSRGKSDLERALEAQKKKIAEINATAGDEQTVSADTVSRQYAAKEAEALEKLRSKYVELADPLQKYREQLDEITKLREAGMLSTGQALEAEWAVNEAMQRQIDTMNGVGEKLKENASFARDFGLAFTSAAEDALVSGKELSEVVKGLGDDIARMIYRKKITEPLGNAASKFIDGFDFGSLFGFATGGSFTVGGSGGTDTSLVAFRATPGEQVTVTPPGGSHEGGGVIIQQHIYPAPGVSSGDLMQAMVQAKNAALAEIYASQRRGGAFA